MGRVSGPRIRPPVPLGPQQHGVSNKGPRQHGIANVRAVVTGTVPRDTAIMYHSSERHINVPFSPLARKRKVSDLRWPLRKHGEDMFMLDGYLSVRVGDEDAPIDLETAIDDTTAFLLVDVASGTTVIPYFAQGVVAVWSDGNLVNFMIEIDNAKARYASVGTAFTPINLRTDAPIASTSTVFRSADADILTLSGKTAGGSLEIYRESIEINMGDAADYWPKMEWTPAVYPVLVGPASFIVHFGAADGGTEPTGYGCAQWAEVPSSSIT